MLHLIDVPHAVHWFQHLFYKINSRFNCEIEFSTNTNDADQVIPIACDVTVYVSILIEGQNWQLSITATGLAEMSCCV